jgi:hypothetical protein
MLDVATQSKLGPLQLTELLTNSNSGAWAFGHQVCIGGPKFELDGCI